MYTRREFAVKTKALPLLVANLQSNKKIALKTSNFVCS
jgi:hypothetical protein